MMKPATLTADFESILVRGYLVYSSGSSYETLYAQLNDGRVFTWTGKRSCDFSPPMRTWMPIHCDVPDSAEYIGLYRVLAKQLLGA